MALTRNCRRKNIGTKIRAASPPHSDPLHGITLETILTQLLYHYGWKSLGSQIKVRCFNLDPSIKSSLQFLRRTPWARTKVEDLYRQHVNCSSKPKPPAQP
ncbi:MAG: VF530 family protein [Verrucomicrobiota bacterium]